jgi:hypothetical protein
MYEDRFVLMFKRMLEQNWLDEAERLIEEETCKRRIEFKKKCRI